jgi:hypothetical protein
MMSKRIACNVPTDDERDAIAEYAASKGLHLADFVRECVYEAIRRRPPKSETLKMALWRVFL